MGSGRPSVPIYEYVCKNCDHTLDALQKISDDPLRDCPACGEPELKRMLSAPRFRLKGAGWYETDFKTDKQRNVLKSDSESEKGATTESKTDKAEAKKPEKTSESTKTTKADTE